MTADPERGGHRGQCGRRGLAVHRPRADPHDQRAIVLAADAGAGGPGPYPDGNAHHPSVRRAVRFQAVDGRRWLWGAPRCPPRLSGHMLAGSSLLSAVVNC
jgi:hypothetical protein